MRKIMANPVKLTEDDLLPKLLNRTSVPVHGSSVFPFRMKTHEFMQTISSKCSMCC
jgi:hypothetical protein